MEHSIMDNMMDESSGHGPRILVYLLLDVSSSMCGPAIQAVNEGVDMLVKELKTVPEAIEMANVCIITFGSNANVITKLTPVSSISAPQISCGGSTNMSGALNLLNTQIDNDFRPTFKGQARGDYKPLVFLLTDGAPNNLTATVNAANALRNRPSGQTVGTFVALGCGPHVNQNNLKQITPHVALMPDMNADNIRAFFKWVTASVVGASKSASQAAGGGGAEGGEAEAPPIPKDAEGNQAFKFTF